MKMEYWTDESGLLSLEIALEDAQSGSHQGRCDEDIADLRRVPYIAAQLDKWSEADVRAELKGYGAWDEDDLADHDSNLNRMLWLACGAVVEEAFQREE